jgi:hypothetical protein
MSSVFEESTQCKYWLFSPDELKNHRMAALMAPAGASTGSSREIVVENPKMASSQHSSGQSKKKGKKQLLGANDTEYEMQEKAIRHFCRQIQLAMAAHKTDASGGAISRKWWRVGPTAIVFFRRFYLFNSVRVHDPRVMLLACLLVAGKAEESVLSLRDLRKIHPKLVEEQVQQAEFTLLKALGAHLHVYHPHNLVQTMTALVKHKHTPVGGKGASMDIDFVAIDSAMVATWLRGAELILDQLYVTPSPLLFKPVEMAYAAMVLTESEIHSSGSVVQAVLSSCYPAASKADAEASAVSLAACVDRVKAIAAEAAVCISGEEAASVGAWVKLSKSGWPKPVSAVKSEMMADDHAADHDGDEEEDEEEQQPKRKRVKQERD